MKTLIIIAAIAALTVMTGGLGITTALGGAAVHAIPATLLPL